MGLKAWAIKALLAGFFCLFVFLEVKARLQLELIWDILLLSRVRWLSRYWRADGMFHVSFRFPSPFLPLVMASPRLARVYLHACILQDRWATPPLPHPNEWVSSHGKQGWLKPPHLQVSGGQEDLAYAVFREPCSFFIKKQNMADSEILFWLYCSQQGLCIMESLSPNKERHWGLKYEAYPWMKENRDHCMSICPWSLDGLE